MRKDDAEEEEQEVYIKEVAASAGWTSATSLGPSPRPDMGARA